MAVALPSSMCGSMQLLPGAQKQDGLRRETALHCMLIPTVVVTGVLEDTMESFFLSETAKYLFLLGANATGLPDFYVLTTEGHLLPPLPASAAAGAGLGSGAWVHGLGLPPAAGHSLLLPPML